METPPIPEGRGHTYRCRSKRFLSCDQGDGKPTRKKCSYCGSPFMIWTGLFIVAEWRGDGMYALDQAYKIFTSAKRAEAWGKDMDGRNGQGVVVRFIMD